jgi:GMP synthase-like glutamine amidotransferase
VSATSPRVLVIQHEASTGPGWFGRWLVEAGLELDVRHPYAGDELPANTFDASDTSDASGLLVLGGAMAPADDATCPWLPAARDVLSAAVDARLPTFGICLGAELLALARGGEVRRGTAGPELGVLDVEVDSDGAAGSDPVFGVLPARVRVVQWHWEEIAALPEGAVLLASSPAYRHQAFRLGEAAWGVQGHPEVTGDIAASWAREDSPLLVAEGRTPEDLVAEVRAAEDELAATWRPLAGAFAEVVRTFHAGGRPAGR